MSVSGGAPGLTGSPNADRLPSEALAENVRRRYPYPLAGIFHRAYYTTSALDEMHEYLLDLFELTVKYCAVVAVSQYLQDELHDPKIDADLLHLQRPSLGHWQAWLREVLALYRRQGYGLKIPELAGFYQQKHAGEIARAFNALRALPQIGQAGQNAPTVTVQQFFELLGVYRNKLAHGVRPGRHDLERVAAVLAPALEALYAELGFLGDYRLAYVSQVNVVFEAGKPSYVHNVTYLSGDNPWVGRPQIRAAPSPNQRLYLLSARGEFEPLVTLHPLLVFLYCDNCSREQVFMLNASDDGHTDYLGYPCTHRYRPDQYFADVRQLLSELKPGKATLEPAPELADEAAPQQEQDLQPQDVDEEEAAAEVTIDDHGKPSWRAKFSTRSVAMGLGGLAAVALAAFFIPKGFSSGQPATACVGGLPHKAAAASQPVVTGEFSLEFPQGWLFGDPDGAGQMDACSPTGAGGTISVSTEMANKAQSTNQDFADRVSEIQASGGDRSNVRVCSGPAVAQIGGVDGTAGTICYSAHGSPATEYAFIGASQGNSLLYELYVDGSKTFVDQASPVTQSVRWPIQ